MLTLTKIQTRENGWKKIFFQAPDGYSFFIQRPNEERIREKVKNPNHPVGESYLERGLEWEIANREVIDSSPEQVAEGYYKLHKKNETIDALLAGLKSDLDEREQQQKEAYETITSMGESSETAQEHLKRAEEIIVEIEEIGQGKIFYQDDKIKITQNNLELIFQEYFRGTDLANISYEWLEIFSPSYGFDAFHAYKSEETLEKINAIGNIITQLKISVNSYSATNRKKYERVLKEKEIEKWILEKAINYNHLHRSLQNNPCRIAYNYKVDIGEKIPWLYEITEIFNNKFDTNLTPVGVFSFIVGGLLGVVFFGYCFTSKIKSIVRSRNTDNRENTHQD